MLASEFGWKTTARSEQTKARMSFKDCKIDHVVESEENIELTAFSSGERVEEMATLGANFTDNEFNKMGVLVDDDSCGETEATNGRTTTNDMDTDAVPAKIFNGKVG